MNVAICTALMLFSCLVTANDPEVTVSTVIPPGGPVTDGLAISPRGVLFGGDALGTGNLTNPLGTTIYRIDGDGSATAFAAGLNIPMGIAFDAGGDLLVAGYGMALTKIQPDGSASPVSSTVGHAGIAISEGGDIFFTRPHSQVSLNQIRRLSPTGFEEVVYQGSPLNGGIGIAIDEVGRIYVANWFDGRIHRLDPDDPLGIELVATIPDPVLGCTGYLAYSDGILYCPGYHKARVYAIAVDTGLVTTLAGTGVAGHVDGPGATAQFSQPNGIAITDSGDSLYVSDDLDRCVRLIVIDPPPTSTPPSRQSSLEQNAPNPFNPATTIEFTLARHTTGSIEIFDLSGRLVTRLGAESRGPGTYRVVWDGTDSSGRHVASGSYLYRLSGADNIPARKMVLLK